MVHIMVRFVNSASYRTHRTAAIASHGTLEFLEAACAGSGFCSSEGSGVRAMREGV
jgi:hypothetical protein